MQGSLLLRQTPFDEIALDLREIGLKQPLISIDVIPVSLAKRDFEDSHVDPPVLTTSFYVSWSRAAKDGAEKAGLHCWSRECLNSPTSSARERA
jgi:hypothetical protein